MKRYYRLRQDTAPVPSVSDPSITDIQTYIYEEKLNITGDTSF